MKLYPIRNISQEIIDNLTKLANYLENNVVQDHFDMEYYYVDNNVEKTRPKEITIEDYNTCGTVACAAGYGPAAGVEPYDNESWLTYICNNFTGSNSIIYDWCFAPEWRYYDNTPEGAAKRIKFMLKYMATPIRSLHIYYNNVEMKEFMEAYNND